MKRTIKLTENDLHRLIKESIRQYITEVDWSTYPSSTDFRDKDAWWKSQVDADFPGHKVDQSRDWKVTYSDLALDKKKRDKEQARIDKQKARAEKKQARLDAKAAKKATKKQNTGRKTTASMKYGDDRLVAELLPDGRVEWYLLDSQKEIQNGGEMDIEEYVDGTWLPYTETYGPGRWIPKQFVNPVAKLFKKIGMRDDDWYGVNENRLRRIVGESVERVLREWQFDNDLDYEKIYDDACDFLSGNHGLTSYGWREIAEELGFRLDSIGPNDMETLKDAIEDAMYEIDAPSTEKADVDFEYDMRK